MKRQIEPSKVDAEKIAEQRAAMKLSQPEFAEVLGVGLQTLRNWENRRRPIPPWVWLFLALVRKVKRLESEVARLREAA